MVNKMEFKTAVVRNEDYSAYLILGCGVIVVKSDFAKSVVVKQGFKKIRKINGYDVGFSLFGMEI